MDNFMDKLAQKLSAQEVIKANSQAEAAEMKKLQLQVAEYEKILQEMRKLNYKNTEISEKIDVQVGENALRVKELQEEEIKLLTTLRDLTDEQIRLREEELANSESDDTLEEIKQVVVKTEDLLKHTEDHIHKENVKVYRNVQAVVVDELNKQTSELTSDFSRQNGRVTVAMIFSILAFLGSIAGIVFQILSNMELLPF